MPRGRAFLVAPRYRLGEIEEHHSVVKDLEQRAARFSMKLDAEVWGWGRFFRTERPVADLAADTGAETLRAAGVAPDAVDGLVVCATSFPRDLESHGALVGELSAALGLTGVTFSCGVTLNRCNNFLAGIAVAEGLVAAGRHARVLVVTADRVEDEAERLESFALFSDGAASCLVSRDAHGAECHEILACASVQDIAALSRSDQIDARLSQRVNEALLGAAGLRLGDVAALMSVNLVRPLVVMKERQAGFSSAQLWTDNIERVGHCFAADPVINLVDHAGVARSVSDRPVMLASSVPGSRHGVLLRRTA